MAARGVLLREGNRYGWLPLNDKVAPATVNGELATLKRIFRLGLVEPNHLLQLGFEGSI